MNKDSNLGVYMETEIWDLNRTQTLGNYNLAEGRLSEKKLGNINIIKL